MSDLERKPCHRSPIRPDRIRKIEGGFSFVPNRFLHDGFLASLDHIERSLYLFLILAGDGNGVSFYACDKICSTLELTLDDYLQARSGLLEKDLIAFDGTRFQVLSLPRASLLPPRPPLVTPEDFELNDPATVRHIIRSSFQPKR